MRHGFVKIAVAVPEIVVADPEYNANAVCALVREGIDVGAQVLVFPELCLSGYTCGDLFLQRSLLDGVRTALEQVRTATEGSDALILVGLPLAEQGALFNVAAVLSNGKLLGFIPKQNLPGYGEFKETRHFTAGNKAPFSEVAFAGEQVPFGTDLLFPHRGCPELIVGAEICEDLWVPLPPSTQLALAGATLICNLSASNELVMKDQRRRSMVAEQSSRLICAYAHSNAGAGESTQDLVFTGHSLLCENGTLLAEREEGSGILSSEIDVQRLEYERRRVGGFVTERTYRRILWGGAAVETKLTRVVSRTPFIPEDVSKRAQRCRKILALQAEGLRKRVQHTGAARLIVGVSGGLDSTLALLVAAMALDKLSRARSELVAVTMPCFGTTKRTRSNAEKLAQELGATLRVVDIKAAVDQHFRDIGHDPAKTDVTYENAQARERTQVLMDLANQYNGMVVGTGDLSELALGWATYNGDHMSMYGVNASVPKTLMRHLVAYYAEACESETLSAVLRDVLDTPVSPELLPPTEGNIAQKTEQLVGPYELHDFFLYYIVRWGFEPAKVFRLARYAFAGKYDDKTIYQWLDTFYRRFFSQQFKRSCLPDGPKIGTVSLSPRGDWNMPSDASRALWLAQLEQCRP